MCAVMFDWPPAMSSARNGAVRPGSATAAQRANDVEVDPGRRAARHDYRPVKLGGRRSATAATPSRKSSVSRRRCCSRSSRAVARSHALGEVAAHGLADREHGQRGRRRDLRRERVRGAAQLVGRDEAVGETDAQRLLAAHVGGGVHELERALLADHRGQRHRDAESLVEPEPGEVAAEPGLGAGDAEVGRERQPEAAADGRALHRGDDRLAVREDASRLRRRGGRCCRGGRCR